MVYSLVPFSFGCRLARGRGHFWSAAASHHGRRDARASARARGRTSRLERGFGACTSSLTCLSRSPKQLRFVAHARLRRTIFCEDARQRAYTRPCPVSRRLAKFANRRLANRLLANRLLAKLAKLTAQGRLRRVGQRKTFTPGFNLHWSSQWVWEGGREGARKRSNHIRNGCGGL